MHGTDRGQIGGQIEGQTKAAGTQHGATKHCNKHFKQQKPTEWFATVQQTRQIQGNQGIPARSRRRLTRDDPDLDPAWPCLALPGLGLRCPEPSPQASPKRAPTGAAVACATCKKSDDTGSRQPGCRWLSPSDAVSRLFLPVSVSPVTPTNFNWSTPKTKPMLRRRRIPGIPPCNCSRWRAQVRHGQSQCSQAPQRPSDLNRNRYPNAAIPQSRVGSTLHSLHPVQ